MSATKIEENATNILKLLFFAINLHFATSNQMSTYRKLNLPLTSSNYFVFLSLEMQKRLEQTKVYHALSYFVCKKTTHKLLKVAAAKTLFSSVFVIGTTCFDECFLFYVIHVRHCFSWKINVTLRFCKRHVAAFFGASVLKEVRIISAITTCMMLIPKVQNKAGYVS